MLSECFLDLNCLPHTLQTKSQIIIVNFGFDPTQVSVCLRLTLKLCLETFTFLMTGPLTEIRAFFFGISKV